METVEKWNVEFIRQILTGSWLNSMGDHMQSVNIIIMCVDTYTRRHVTDTYDRLVSVTYSSRTLHGTTTD